MIVIQIVVNGESWVQNIQNLIIKFKDI